MTDLKRQVVLLQQQGEDKDRTIRQLQRQLEAANRSRVNGVTASAAASRSPPAVNGISAASNVATQTDRVRGPSTPSRHCKTQTEHPSKIMNS